MPGPNTDAEAKAPRPFFRLGGCLLALLLALGLGMLIATWMVVSGGLPSDPMLLPPLEETNTSLDWDRIRQNLQRGEIIELDQPSWNSFLTEIIDNKIESGQLLAGSGARLSPQPDGSLQLLLSIGFGHDLEEVPWLARGRFINLEIIGDIEIADGSITKAKINLYQWGSIYRGENLPEETSKSIASDLLAEITPVVGKIRLLQHEKNQLRFSISE